MAANIRCPDCGRLLRDTDPCCPFCRTPMAQILETVRIQEEQCRKDAALKTAFRSKLAGIDKEIEDLEQKIDFETSAFEVDKESFSGQVASYSVLASSINLFHFREKQQARAEIDSIKKKAYEVEKAHQSNLVSYSRQLSILKMQRKYQSPVDWVGAATLQILETQEADGVGYTVAEIVEEAVSLHEILDTRSIIRRCRKTPAFRHGDIRHLRVLKERI